MELSTLKDLGLVIIGATATFVFTLIASRIQGKSPKLHWRKLPPLKIPAHELSGSSWIIENSGKKSAKQVVMEIRLPEGASINNYDIISSENALPYSVNLNEKNTSLSISVPLFPNGVSIDISCLASNLQNQEPIISIIGEDVIGKEFKDDSDIQQKIDKYYSWFQVASIGFGGIATLFLVIFMVLFSSAKLQLDQSRAMAELFISDAKYEQAIKIYDQFRKSSWIYNNESSLLLDIAKLHALNNELEKSLEILILAAATAHKTKASTIKVFITTTPVFDPLRVKPEYVALVEKLNVKISANNAAN